MSIITNIELFSANNIPNDEFRLLEKIMGIATIHPVSNDLVSATVSIRQKYRLKMPDAIIAATALTYNLVLITRNTVDFKRIPELRLVDLHKL